MRFDLPKVLGWSMQGGGSGTVRGSNIGLPIEARETLSPKRQSY